MTTKKLTKEYLLTLDPISRNKAIFKEFLKCKRNPKYCIETYFTVVAKSKRIDFKLFPHQDDALTAYEKYQNIITMKTRQMGFTTFSGAYICWNLMTKSNFQVLIISKKLTDTIKFIGEIKAIIDLVIKDYPWLCKGYVDGENNKQRFVIQSTLSCVTGQSTTEDAGRGFSAINLLVIDEVAFIDRVNPNKMSEIMAAAGVAQTTVSGKTIAISTPKGQSGWYYETYINAHKRGWKIVNAPWSMHPIYSKGMYQWVNDKSKKGGGELKFFNNEWPEQLVDKESGMIMKIGKDEYKFICDGKKRSPWYDFESTKLGEMLTRCELDCSFMGTGGEVFEPEILNYLTEQAENSPFKEYIQPFKDNGIFKDYKEYISFKHGHRYILGSDVATGDGSDYSTIAVIDIDTLELCATFKGQMIPTVFAELVMMVGRRYNKCCVIIENAGGGGTTLDEVKASGYGNIYYSVLKKTDPSTGMKKKKLGLWPSEDVRRRGGDRLEESIRFDLLKIPCKDLIAEFYTWIWDKDAKRRHAPDKHDDLIMAVQHAIFYIYYTIRRADKNKTVFNNVFEKQINGVSIRKVESKNQFTSLGSIIKKSETVSMSIKPVMKPNATISYDIEQTPIEQFINRKINYI